MITRGSPGPLAGSIRAVPLRIATLVKQIPGLAELRLDEHGRLDRSGPPEMNPYCRRAVAGSVDLLAEHGGTMTVVTLGPPAARDVLREAIAWAADRHVDATGVLVSDPELAGSDTLATARALAAVLRRLGPFDLVVAGRSTVDGETGQVPPQLAELLDLPLLTGVREWSLGTGVLEARCELDDGAVRARVRLPTLVTTAERLVEPCKVEPAARAAVSATRITGVDAATLGPGPWGAAGSPTWVGPPRPVPSARSGARRPDLDLADQVAHAVGVLRSRRALDPDPPFQDVPTAHGPVALDGPIVAAIAEPGRDAASRSLVSTAARLAHAIGGHAAAISFEREAHGIGRGWARWGAGRSVEVSNALGAEDAAAAVTAWSVEACPWAILAISTSWGREVTARTSAALGAGMTGDAIEVGVAGGRLEAWKSAFGGQCIVPVGCTSPTQVVTLRPGTLTPALPRPVFDEPRVAHVSVAPRRRVEVLEQTRDGLADTLATARRVIGIGRGVRPEDLPALTPLAELLDAPLAASRKVTDAGWLPRSVQIGITGISVAPALYLAIGTSGRFNHAIGFRNAGTVLAIDTDPDAPVFEVADVGIIGDWREVVPLLVEAIEANEDPA